MKHEVSLPCSQKKTVNGSYLEPDESSPKIPSRPTSRISTFHTPVTIDMDRIRPCDVTPLHPAIIPA